MRLDAVTDHTTHFLLQLRNRHFFVLDFWTLLLAPYLALWLREDSYLLEQHYLAPLILLALVTLPLWLGIFIASGLYTRNWQFASVDELGVIFKAVLMATGVNVFAFYLILRPLGWIPDDFPRSIPFLTGLLTLVLIGGTRFSVRLMDRARRQRQFTGREHRRVVVFGAGEAGAAIVREMQANPQLGLNPVAFLDDDPRKDNTTIYGVPVVGGRAALGRVVRDDHVQEAIIAMPAAPGKLIREIAAECLRHHLVVKTIPGMYELLDGSVTVSKLRDVEIDDLLHRETLSTDGAAVAAMLRGKRVLVTGAGGSIGGELCRQIARCAPAQLILLGHGENSLFYQSSELALAYPELALATVVADVRDAPRITAVMARWQPHLVFHAAAHKHVSLMEANLEDAVTNNVLGTRVMVDAAVAQGVEAFVMISSDKAVNPVSVMGATKRVAELYVHARALESGRRLAAVRFGNVLGSRGSVVPIFKQQIAAGGPVRVTHPDVRRFFMTIPEAVHLVLEAATVGQGGEIFALDMGEPVRIVDLAQDLIRLSGLEVGRDIDIEFTGLRPGEKLCEELFITGEAYERTAREKIYVARNGIKPTAEANARLYAHIDQLIRYAQQGDAAAIRAYLAVIVPEFGTSHAAATPVLDTRD